MTRARYASDPALSRGRLHPEALSTFRSPFQRDRDRIIHSSAFRRLKHKTQVFVEHEGDYFRTRLTHSIEVAQVARTIAGALGLNEELTEAVALAHDLGHPPFGRAAPAGGRAAVQEGGAFDGVDGAEVRRGRGLAQLGDAAVLDLGQAGCAELTRMQAEALAEPVHR